MSEAVTCALCGFAFPPDENSCGGCAKSDGCGVLKCPNCGGEMPPVTSPLAEALRRLMVAARGKVFHA